MAPWFWPALAAWLWALGAAVTVYAATSTVPATPEDRPIDAFTEPPAAELPAAWPEIYPEMRRILDTLITTGRHGTRRSVDVPHLERVRRDLGQLDRGTYEPCTQSPTGWNPFAAFRLIREVAYAAPLGHPAAAPILRLAADLAEQNAAARRALNRPTTEG